MPHGNRKLYEYLVEKRCIEQLDNYNPAYLSIFSRDVIAQIKAGDASWSEKVPAEVADAIRRRGFFGHRRALPAKENSTLPAGIGGADRRPLLVCPTVVV